MNKPKIKYLVDSLLFICFLATAFVGVILGFIIPEGPAVSGSKYFLGLHRHQWGGIHLYMSLAFLALILIHLILSWNWIKCQAKLLFKRFWPHILVLTGITAALAMILIWIFSPKFPLKYDTYGQGKGIETRRTQRLQEPPVPAERESDPLSSEEETPSLQPGKSASHETPSVHGREESSSVGITITGRMTLRQLADETGLLLEDILKELGLPPETSPEDTLGRLRRHYSFAIDEVRSNVARLLSKQE